MTPEEVTAAFAAWTEAMPLKQLASVNPDACEEAMAKALEAAEKVRAEQHQRRYGNPPAQEGRDG